jgi:hypothetical protein
MRATTPGTSDARRVVVGASLAFAALLTLGAWLLLWARGETLPSVFDSGQRGQRVLVGASIGALAASVCALVVRRARGFARLRALAQHAVEGIEPRWHTVLIVALAAGFSEELFFRGALEPAIGRWFASLAFIALHGAHRLRDPGTGALAAFLFGASVGLSALNAWKGLEAAMAAHAAYDLTMLAWLARASSRSVAARGI